MVDPINSNSTINSLLRAQQSAAASSPKSTAQALVKLPQKNASVVVKTSVITQTGKASSAHAKLPRGSLVDVLA